MSKASELGDILFLTELRVLETRLNSSPALSCNEGLSTLFIDCIYLKVVLQLMIEDHWIQNKRDPSHFQMNVFVEKFFSAELKPLSHLQRYFQDVDVKMLSAANNAMIRAERILLGRIQSLEASDKINFTKFALLQMSDLFEFEQQLNSSPTKGQEDSKLSLYRSFDILDEIFELEYLQNEPVSVDQKERLYENAGVGVQSSYASTLQVLRHLKLDENSRFIDLGSGYGRIGLVVGLLRPDIQFTGYEFVNERVAIVNRACANFKLQSHVHFITQDLSHPEFKLPLADTYYIFDSFTDTTYSLIMNQLEKLSQKHAITIVTKGNARHWLKNQSWQESKSLNEGNIRIFSKVPSSF